LRFGFGRSLKGFLVFLGRCSRVGEVVEAVLFGVVVAVESEFLLDDLFEVLVVPVVLVPPLL